MKRRISVEEEEGEEGSNAQPPREDLIPCLNTYTYGVHTLIPKVTFYTAFDPLTHESTRINNDDNNNNDNNNNKYQQQ